jgi:hypothetical protein
MSCAKMLRVAGWVVVAMSGQVGWAQTVAAVAAAVPAKGQGSQRAIKFSAGKIVPGMPPGGSRSMMHCSDDNTAFFNLAAGSAGDLSGVPELYSVSTGGEVKHLLRKMPIGFSDVSVRDFYVTEHTLVTMLEAVKRDDESSPVRERDYLLSVSDRDGDLASLLKLDARFKPLKIALFGSGDYLLLGWDEGNLVPKLALLKEDGTIRRFIDLDEHKAETKSAGWGKVDLKMMEGAAFVAFGSEVMLTYPGTTKPVIVLNAAGDVRMIPIYIPGGYVLHDVLYSGTRGGTLVVRVKAEGDESKKATDEPLERLFELNSYDGNLVREFTFDRQKVSEVACAAHSTLTAIFYQPVASADRTPANANDKPSADGAETAMQLVVATVRR